MEAKSLLNLGKGANLALIFANLAMFAYFTIEKVVAGNLAKNIYSITQEQINSLEKWITGETVIRVIVGVVALAALIICIFCMIKNEGKLKGWGLLLPAAIVSGAFAIFGLMLGMVIWVLCGISISMLTKSYNEYTSAQTFGAMGNPANNFTGVPLNNGFDQGYNNQGFNNNGFEQQGGYTDPFNNQNNQNNGF